MHEGGSGGTYLVILQVINSQFSRAGGGGGGGGGGHYLPAHVQLLASSPLNCGTFKSHWSFGGRSYRCSRLRSGID